VFSVPTLGYRNTNFEKIIGNHTTRDHSLCITGSQEPQHPRL